MVFGRDMSHQVEFDYQWKLPGGLQITDPLSGKQYSGDSIRFSASVGQDRSGQGTVVVNRFEYELIEGQKHIISVGMARNDGKTVRYEVSAHGYDLKRNPGRVWHPPTTVRFYGFPDEAIEDVVKHGGLVIDIHNEIFDEYRANLSMAGQPGMGDRFLKWVHDNRWGFPEEDRVRITKIGNTYEEFPEHTGLKDFDLSDRKFVAVANAHPAQPPILQATDSKWWRWKDALAEVGVNVTFLCEDWIRKKHDDKMGGS